MSNIFIPDLGCATDWSAIDDIDINCPDDGTLSEVQYVLMMDTTHFPALGNVLSLLPDWTDSGDWIGAIDNSSATGFFAKQLVGVGNVSTAAPSTRQMPGHKQSMGEAVSTLSFKLMSLPDSIYDFLNNLRATASLPRIWLVTVGGKMFGGPAGIELDSLSIPFALAEGVDSYEEQVVTMNWKAKTAPLRIASPV